MLVDSAVALINSLSYKTDWHIVASDMTSRHESAVRVEVTYPAEQSERDEFPLYGTPVRGGARAAFLILVGDCQTDKDLYFRLLSEIILPIEMHEAREFLRVAPTGWAPFHPHRVEGMHEWAKRSGLANVEHDLKFGLASY